MNTQPSSQTGQRLSCVVSTYVFDAFDCMFLLCHVHVSSTSWTSIQGLPSIACALSRHLLHLKSGSSTSQPGISEHFWWTYNEHPLQKIKFFLMPFLHTAQEYLPEVCNVWRSLPEIITLVFPMFTFNSFDFRPFFHAAILVIRPSNASTKITRSSP